MLWKAVKLKFRWILPKQAHEWFWIFLLCGHGGVLQVLTCMGDKDWNDEDVYWVLCQRLHVHSYYIRSHITLSQLGSMSQASHWEHRVSRILSRVSRILSCVSRTMHCLRFHVYLSRISLTFRSHITLFTIVSHASHRAHRVSPSIRVFHAPRILYYTHQIILKPLPTILTVLQNISNETSSSLRKITLTIDQMKPQEKVADLIRKKTRKWVSLFNN